MTHRALLLAAGGSRRLGFPKQLLLKDGVPLVRHTAQLLLQTKPSQLIIITGGYVSKIESTLTTLPAKCVFNPEWETGLASSLKTALKYFSTTETSPILIATTDQPLLDLPHLLNLIQMARQDRNVITGYGPDNTAGIPACISARTFERAKELQGDEGFRRLWSEYSKPIRLENPHLYYDIDTPQALAWAIQTGVLDEPKF